MPRRLITSDIWVNEKFGCLPTEAKLLFIGCITTADDDGRLKGTPKYLKARIFPYESFSDEQISGWMEGCVEAGILRHYSVNGANYLDLPGWLGHQQIRKDRYTPSKHPAISMATWTSPHNAPADNINDQFLTSEPTEKHTQWFLAQKLSDNIWNPTNYRITQVEVNKRLANLYADIVADTDTDNIILIEIKEYPLTPKDLAQVIRYRDELAKVTPKTIVTFLIGSGTGILDTQEAITKAVTILFLSDIYTTLRQRLPNGDTSGRHNIIESKVIESKVIESKRDTPTKKIKDKKNYGEFKNVLLTGEEYQKLQDKFGSENMNEMIEALSLGIESKGYKYKSHYATLLNWDRKDQAEKAKQKEPKDYTGGKYGHMVRQ